MRRIKVSSIGWLSNVSKHKNSRKMRIKLGSEMERMNKSR